VADGAGPGFRSSSPAISGDKIVWQDNRNGNQDVYLYDLTDNTETRITTDAANQIYPAISGNRIVWEEYRNINADIYMATLAYDNQPPTDISLSGSSINENASTPFSVGTLSVTDPDAGDAHAFSLTCDIPGADDNSFRIANSNELQMNVSADYETKSSYGVCIRATDIQGATFEKDFTVAINDLDDTSPSTPVIIGPTNGMTIQNRNPVISGTAEANSTVTVSVNGKSYAGTSDSSGNFSITVTDDLSDGGHVASVTATDSQSNVSPATTVSFIVEAEAGGRNNGDRKSAEIDSWDAYQYTDKSECASRLKLIIRGHHFDKDAKVTIGGKEASDTERKSSRKLTATFCMDKLLGVKTDLKRKLRVTNPGADSAKADSKIDLETVFKKFTGSDFDTFTKNGIRSVQQALVKLGLLTSEGVTGSYDDQTADAIRGFQGDNDIPQTGFIGPLTRGELQRKYLKAL